MPTSNPVRNTKGDPDSGVISDFWQQSFDPVAAPFGTFETSKFWDRATNIAQSGTRTVLGGVVKKLQAPLLKSPQLLLDVEYGGLKLRLSPAYYSQERALIKAGRHPEDEELSFLDGCKGLKVNFVDIGANTGFYSLHAARLADPGSNIIAIEPDPRNFRKLEFQVHANGFKGTIECLECAIGAEQGTLALHVPDKLDFGQNTLVPGSAGQRQSDAVEVSVLSLLDVVNQFHLERIDYLKIDVEGYEDRALLPFYAQAPRELWPRQVLMEAKISKTWEKNVIAEMTSIGYSVVRESDDNIWLALGQ